MKKCSKCGDVKNDNDFRKGDFNRCRKCISEYQRNHRTGPNRQRILDRMRDYRNANKKKLREGKKACYQRRKKHYIEKAKKWAEENRTARRRIAREWAIKHKSNRLKNNRKARELLMSCYVRYTLTKGTKLRAKDLPKILIEAKTEELRLRRLLKNENAKNAK